MKRAVALFDFQKHSRVASLLHQLKYRGQEETGAFLGDWLTPILLQSKVFNDVGAAFAHMPNRSLPSTTLIVSG